MTSVSPAADPTKLECDVLIVGASFAGIEVYRRLRRDARGRELRIILVDRQADHGYIPLAHERLTDRLPLEESVLHTQRSVGADKNVRYLVDEVIDSSTTSVRLRSGAEVQTRMVIYAVGSDLAPPASLVGREHLLRYKFSAEFSKTKARLRRAFEEGENIIVVGGGISGVELAGDLAHAARSSAQSYKSKIILVEMADRLLSGITERAGRRAHDRLREQGVELHLSTSLVEVSESSLRLRSSQEAEELTIGGVGIWAAGIRPSPLLERLGLPLTKRGYLAVDSTLQSQVRFDSQRPTVFGCGDAVRVVDERGEWPTMQRAIECIWQAKVVATNILILARGGTSGRLKVHTLWRDFPYGVSVGASSMVVFGRLVIELGRLGVWFRRWLMRMYFRRYARMRIGEERARVPRRRRR